MTRTIIQRYEHEKLLLRDSDINVYPGQAEKLLEALEIYHGDGSPYFSLIRNGVKFSNYVGVIQVGNTTIEILPKVDQLGGNKDQWKDILVDMLRVTMGIEAKSTSEAQLRTKRNSILDLYTELFINECERITHKGLVKKYIRKSENRTALKGKLNMTQHIRSNLVHKERFHLSYDSYEKDHTINQLLAKTLAVLLHITRDGWLIDRIKNQELHFLDVADIKPTNTVFDKLRFGRKSDHYQRAMNISKIILLNYHPDISSGKEDVLAIMFDMNDLWEKYIAQLLRKEYSGRFIVKTQNKKLFWSTNRSNRKLKPDIFLKSKISEQDNIIIDTKWKNTTKGVPSDEDLRQIFAYNKSFETNLGVLFYPGPNSSTIGRFRTEEGSFCNLFQLNLLEKEEVQSHVLSIVGRV